MCTGACEILVKLKIVRNTTVGRQHTNTPFLWKGAISAVQILAYFLLFPFRFFIVNGLTRHGKPSDMFGTKQKARIVYANHQSRADPFLVCASLPFRTFLRLVPFRFFVFNPYFRGVGTKTFLTLFGGFRAKHHPQKPHGLDFARQLLHDGQTIVIFPQGKRTREPIAKSGIAVLGRELEALFLPVYLDWRNRFDCRIVLGSPFEGSESADAHHYMDIVYRLGDDRSNHPLVEEPDAQPEETTQQQ